MNAKTISILGCGWLGLPLAEALIHAGYNVKGSTTTAGKTAILNQKGIAPFLIKCNPSVNGASLPRFFDSDILFLNIPFKRDLKDPDIYKKQIASVIKKVEASSIRFVIFASSTSVYPRTLTLAKENSNFLPDNKRSRILLEIEEELLNNKHFSVTVLRFAGLLGGERKIGGFLSGKTDLIDDNSPVNLVHLEDCIAIIVRIIKESAKDLVDPSTCPAGSLRVSLNKKNSLMAQIFNVCCDKHPLRRELYTKAALKQKQPPPVFLEGKKSPRKIVDNKKLKKHLGYRFKYPDPMKCLQV